MFVTTIYEDVIFSWGWPLNRPGRKSFQAFEKRSFTGYKKYLPFNNIIIWYTYLFQGSHVFLNIKLAWRYLDHCCEPNSIMRCVTHRYEFSILLLSLHCTKKQILVKNTIHLYFTALCTRICGRNYAKKSHMHYFLKNDTKILKFSLIMRINLHKYVIIF